MKILFKPLETFIKMKHKLIVLITIISIFNCCTSKYVEQTYNQNTIRITRIKKEKDVYIITAQKRNGEKIKIISYYDKNIEEGKRLRTGSLFNGSLQKFFPDSIGGKPILQDPYIVSLFHDVEISPAKLKTDSIFLAPSLNGPYTIKE